ncbi:rhombosortase [Alteromonadaceae bacterium BrNp21-10]|nr:rhombosortase [Alteromonadaceae bacterium BrNp21-10]
MAFPLQRHQLAGPLTILLIALLFFLFNDHIYSHLVYEREAILQGQWWRLITGHFLHSNFNHLLLNSGGVILLWALHGDDYKTSSYLYLMLIMTLGTGLGLLILSPQMQWYVGLSGALHGLFVWGARQDIKHGRRSGWLLMLGVIAKIIYEQAVGASTELAQFIDANVAIDAHLYGTICGLIWISTTWLISRRNRNIGK